MDYFKELNNIFSKIEVSDKKGNILPFDKAISKIIDLIIKHSKRKNKVLFIGNGGSASIASHMYTDFLKNAKIPSFSFNDSSLITCLSNDLGYEYVFQKPVEILANAGDILFAISSSGRSKNILNAAKKAKNKSCSLVTLSGFKKENPLRKLGDINFYVPSDSYGHVEIVHLAICHYIVDMIMKD